MGFALGAIYCSPLEMLVANLWPFLGIVGVYRFHLFTSYCWVWGAIIGTQAHHAGYAFPWKPKFDIQPIHHDLHHEFFNCNYGNTGWLDALHGTVRKPARCKVA